MLLINSTPAATLVAQAARSAMTQAAPTHVCASRSVSGTHVQDRDRNADPALPGEVLAKGAAYSYRIKERRTSDPTLYPWGGVLIIVA